MSRGNDGYEDGVGLRVLRLSAYLFEVCVFWDLHDLYVLLLSMRHEGLLYVLRGALVHGHRYNLEGAGLTELGKWVCVCPPLRICKQ